MVNSPTGQIQNIDNSALTADSAFPGTANATQHDAQVDLDPAFVAALLAQNSVSTAQLSGGATSAGPSHGDVLALAQPILKSNVPEDDRIKLMVVLDSIDPADILSQHVSQLSGSDGTSCSLRDGLRSSHATPLALRAAINDACTSAMFASLDMSRTTLDAIDEYRHVALALIGEIETRAAKRAGQRGKGVKREEAEADHDDMTTKPPPPKKFMLHRTVGPAQSIDLFTAAANLTDSDLAQLATVPDTDLISVWPPAFTPGTTQPTLGDVNPPTRLPSVVGSRAPPEPRDVQMLYYDPYSSFAPSLDSSGADAGLRDSTRRAVAKSRIHAWDQMQDELSSKAFDLPKTTASMDGEPVALTEDERAVLSEIGVDPAEFEDGWQSLQQERSISKKLESNAILIAELMRGRWRRLREVDVSLDPGKTLNTGKPQGEPTAKNLLKANESEVDAAQELLSSFTALLSLRPRALRSGEIAPTTALPSSSALRAALPRLLASMEREASFGGTLDVNDARAVKDSEMMGQQQQQMQLDFGDLSAFGYGGDSKDISV